MKKINLISLSLLLLFFSCKKDFVVTDISKKTLAVNAPANGLVTTLNLITFWWEPLDGAESYNLQVVKPNFSKVAQLVLDTNVTANKFLWPLEPGTYQWRIKASNAGHSTAFHVFNLQIDSSVTLSGLFVNLLNPANGTVTGARVMTFRWNKLYNAKTYNLQINNGSILDTTLSGAQLTYSLPAAINATTAYSWKVKAISDNSESGFNQTPFTFTVDLKPPAAPSLNTPLNGAVASGSTTLSWTRNNAAEVAYDSVYVSTDSLFTNVISQSFMDKTSSKISELEQAPASPNTTYWWRVRSFDAVGNRSGPSPGFKFTFIP